MNDISIWVTFLIKRETLQERRSDRYIYIYLIIQDNIFGDTQETVIIEELLRGEEFTVWFISLCINSDFSGIYILKISLHTT